MYRYMMCFSKYRYIPIQAVCPRMPTDTTWRTPSASTAWWRTCGWLAGRPASPLSKWRTVGTPRRPPGASTAPGLRAPGRKQRYSWKLTGTVCVSIGPKSKFLYLNIGRYPVGTYWYFGAALSFLLYRTPCQNFINDSLISRRRYILCNALSYVVALDWW